MQDRTNEAKKFFDLLFGNIPERKFSYLWTKQGNTSTTYPFDVSSDEARAQMARKAIELNDDGADVYFGVNLGDNPPDTGKRFTKEQVTLQTATVTDIDIEGGNHTNSPQKIYPPNFDIARVFLPFKPSILVDSGFGLHGYCLYQEPITVTADNREDCTKRNQNFISVIRNRAGVFGGAVDGVGDLPRVLRVPGTFNYKCGRENAPLCRIIEVNDVRFIPQSFDAALKPFLPKTAALPKQAEGKSARRTFSDGNEPTTLERLDAMLTVIPPADLPYEEWLNIGMAIKNEGGDVSIWEQWSRNDTRFKDGECERKWQGFKRNGMTIATVHEIAQRYGYSEKNFLRGWYSQRQETKPRPAPKQAGTFADADTQADVMNDAEPKSKEEIIANIRNQCEWKHDNKDRRTTIKPTQGNLDLIFENDPNLRGLFGYDQFQGATVLLKQAPWHDEDRTGDQWTDADDAELRIYIRRNYAELEHKQRIEDSVINFANRNAFHPVKKFFKNLPRWDGIPRAETLFIKFLRVTDTAYARAVTMNWLTAAVARIFHPGCNYQCALTICGAQGIGKSYLAERLGGKWYGAIIDDVSDPHAVDALQSIWIGEVKEMSGMRKDINANKSFIERAVDIRRGAYEKRATPRPRHCVFYISVNDAEFLRDVTGNRRYLILKCNSKSLDFVDGLTTKYVAQVWAEVYQHYCELFKDGFDDEKLALSREIQREAEDIAQNYLQDDGLTTEIKSFLDKRLPPAVIWRLMSKEERRKFFADGCITFTESTLNHRRRGQGGRSADIQRDIDGIYTLLHSQHGTIQKIELGTETSYRFYGFELREHICSSEVFNEAFSNGDKRKLMYRINEILSQLEGWHLGKRLRNADPEYREQKKPYFRDADNRPADEDNEICNSSELYGEYVDPNDTPF